jgi:hypothetical protein
MASYSYPIQCRTVTARLQRVGLQAAGIGPPCTCCKRRKDAGLASPAREPDRRDGCWLLLCLSQLERSPRPRRKIHAGINCMSAAARAARIIACVPVRLARRDDGQGPPGVRRLVATRVVLQLELATVWLAVAATASKMPLSLCCGVVVRARWRSIGKQGQSSF